MKKYIFPFLLLLFAATIASAQKTFVFKNVSDNFDVKIRIAKCEDDACNDKATVYVMKKDKTTAFQTIEIEEMFLRLSEAQTSDRSTGEISGDGMGGIYFKDYNFDGADDMALSNGNYAPYGGISYEVFLFSKAAGKFVKHVELSELTTENTSVDVDKTKKIIETSTKNGCCWYQTARYKFVGSRLVKIYVFTEDAMGDDGKVRLITEKLVGKKWKKTTKTMLRKDYYKDDQ